MKDIENPGLNDSAGGGVDANSLLRGQERKPCNRRGKIGRKEAKTHAPRRGQPGIGRMPLMFSVERAGIGGKLEKDSDEEDHKCQKRG